MLLIPVCHTVLYFTMQSVFNFMVNPTQSLKHWLTQNAGCGISFTICQLPTKLKRLSA